MSYEDFIKYLKLIKRAGIKVKRDKTIAHFPLYKVDDGSIEQLEIGYCYLPRTHYFATLVSKKQRKGISVTISLHKHSCRTTLSLVKQLYTILPNADYYFDDSGRTHNNPVEKIRQYLTSNKTLKRTR